MKLTIFFVLIMVLNLIASCSLKPNQASVLPEKAFLASSSFQKHRQELVGLYPIQT